MERERQNGTKFVDANREHLERSKIRIASRQWVIERILANKYGPKPTVVVNNQQNTVSLDPAEAAAVSSRSARRSGRREGLKCFPDYAQASANFRRR